MILIYKRPDIGDGCVGVMTPPQATVLWLIVEPEPRDRLREGALRRGLGPAEIDAILAAADLDHFGSAISPDAEPAAVETEARSFGAPMLLLKSGDGYVGFVPPTRYPPRRVPAALRADWCFARPISQRQLLDGMQARGHHAQDIWDLISCADERGWGYG